MVDALKKKYLRTIDDAFTFGGTISPKARDVAALASLPELEEKIVDYRIRYLLNKLGGVGLNALKTWGIFHIGQGGEASYMTGRVGTAVNEISLRQGRLAYYDDVYDPAYHKYYEIPAEIRARMDESLVEGGIPENKVGVHTIANLIHGINTGVLSVDLAAGLLTPVAQVVASGEKMPLEAKVGLLAVSYLGLLVGPGLARSMQKANFEWNVARTAARNARESNGLGATRIEMVKKWANDNLDRFNRHYLFDGLVKHINDFLAAGAIFAKRVDLFGTVSMIDGAAGGFVEVLNTMSALKDAEISAKTFKLANEFCQSGIYLPTEESWDAYRFRGNWVSDMAPFLRDGEVCRFYNFGPRIKDQTSVEISGSLYRGKMHLVEGKSGEGKSLFLFALRGLVKNSGDAYFNGPNIFCMSMFEMRQAELRKRVAYYSPDDFKGRGLRVVDMYADAFLNEHGGEMGNKHVERSLCVEDSLLERQLEGKYENEWENGLFFKSSDEDKVMAKEFRQKRIEFAHERLKKLGANMGEVDPCQPLSSLSTGMRERVLLDRILYALEKGVEIVVLDEPLGRVDPETARGLIAEICERIKRLPEEKRPAVVLVSNVHKIEIQEEVQKALGSDGLIKIEVSRDQSK